MRAFHCDNCAQLIFFDNDRCLRCGSPLGYVHERRTLITLAEVAPGRLVEFAQPTTGWQRCATSTTTACNWLVRTDQGALCESCALTRTRPADEDAEGMEENLRAEMAKRRLVFQLAELGLPVEPRDEGAGKGLAFDLLSSSKTKVITGHDDGVITLDLSEADDQHREYLRRQLNEPYRTVLGHFRHEIGHYFWPVLVADDRTLAACRALFGDDRSDYQEAVERHYKGTPDPTFVWSDTHVSRYATMHPFEDWAETFAHYLHILDTLQTALSFGLGIPDQFQRCSPSAGQADDPTRPDDSGSFGELVDHWLTFTYALNHVNRSMGREDLYPFVLAPGVIRKLAFVDRLVRGHRRGGQTCDV